MQYVEEMPIEVMLKGGQGTQGQVEICLSHRIHAIEIKVRIDQILDDHRRLNRLHICLAKPIEIVLPHVVAINYLTATTLQLAVQVQPIDKHFCRFQLPSESENVGVVEEQVRFESVQSVGI